jgi:hypothetical protein
MIAHWKSKGTAKLLWTRPIILQSRGLFWESIRPIQLLEARINNGPGKSGNIGKQILRHR